MTTDERLDRVDASIEKLHDYLLQFRGEVIQRLDSVDQRLEVLGGSLAGIDARLPPMTKAVLHFGAVESALVARLTALEEKVSKLMNPAA